MSSQITPQEDGVRQVFQPQRDAEYQTLQQQIDEDALAIIDNKKRVQAAKDLIRSLQEDSRRRNQRRKRNIARKRIVLKSQYDLLMVEEQDS